MQQAVILVVDDEPNTRNGIAFTLRELGEGITVETAENGAAALELLTSKHYDLLLTDIRMPVMDGIKLLEQLREQRQMIACILLTGYAEFSYAQSALRLGAVDYLLKPVRQEQLLEAVQKVLEEREESADHPEEELSAVGNPFVEKAIDYIKEHIDESLSIKDVAGHVHLNVSYFSVLFKEEQGMTFIDYVTDYRLKMAEELLVQSNLSLDEISEKIGYQTTSYFIKIFKKHFQVTPKQYRSQIKRDEIEKMRKTSVIR